MSVNLQNELKNIARTLHITFDWIDEDTVMAVHPTADWQLSIRPAEKYLLLQNIPVIQAEKFIYAIDRIEMDDIAYLIFLKDAVTFVNSQCQLKLYHEGGVKFFPEPPKAIGEPSKEERKVNL